MMTRFSTPVGMVEAHQNGAHLFKIDIVESKAPFPPATPVLTEAQKQIIEYFEGKRQEFDLPVKFPVFSDFKIKVWNEIAKVPYGATTTYKAIAAAVGHPEAVRAVGNACNHNPVLIVVPCHRVIGSQGFLTSYAKDMKIKSALLELESPCESLPLFSSF
ncbi:methylated-DNA-[protein]-cysteine S-methyltransferase [Parelusimicrobium proximum]|uniref:methylated-DNA--[protein]-cysteine S-methyltransferase n=1 Tax=Parelusimicrobium proximum TaxID=3228953 RepID=UPI003D1749B5